ncbi:MAG: EVE domain-containing protein [Maritimibacter sp.]
MRYWLFKSEPGTWGWDDQLAKGEAGEEWDGVRNYEKRIVGIVEVCKEVHPDSTTDDPRWECVDIKAVRPLANSVTLDMCKADPRLADMVLIKNSRLSVQPVSPEEWAVVLDLASENP